MAVTLTDDEVGKKVIDAEGKELGIIAKVDSERAFVDPNPSVTEHVLAKVGWEGEDEEDYVVTSDMLATVDENVVLRGNL